MPVASNTESGKYRGSKEYLLVYCELIRTARYKGMTTYQAIAQIMGLPLEGSYMGKEVGQMLGEIVRAEVEHGRPMLSAIAVGVSGFPGPGLFALARELGMLTDASKEAERHLWQKEVAVVYETWCR